MNIHLHIHYDESKLDLIIHKLNHMAANTDKALADLGLIKTQLGKVGTETAALLVKITELEAAAAEADTPQTVLDAIAEVKAQAQVVDDQVPDAPPVEPPVA
jgi:hypothetical protein